MERRKRKYKRTITHDFFKEDVKKQMEIGNFKSEPHGSSFPTPLILMNVKLSLLAIRIKKLPRDIQVKVYISAMQNYWKEITLKTHLKPIWYDTVSYMNNQKRKALFENIHFLHLECNTLETMKSWIPGCQCVFCLNDKIVEKKQEIYNRIYHSDNCVEELEKRTHCYDEIPNFWNSYIVLYMGLPFGSFVQFVVYDPIKNQFGDEFRRIHEDPIESPIYFSEEITSQYY